MSLFDSIFVAELEQDLEKARTIRKRLKGSAPKEKNKKIYEYDGYAELGKLYRKAQKM